MIGTIQEGEQLIQKVEAKQSKKRKKLVHLKVKKGQKVSFFPQMLETLYFIHMPSWREIMDGKKQLIVSG